jgi:hypothetical protein
LRQLQLIQILRINRPGAVALIGNCRERRGINRDAAAPETQKAVSGAADTA